MVKHVYLQYSNANGDETRVMQGLFESLLN